VALPPLLLPLAAVVAAPLFPLMDRAAPARERVLDLLSATAARNTDGADHPLTTAALVATLPSVLAPVAVLLPLRQHPALLLLPRRFPPTVLAELREVLLALARHSVIAARSTDGADLLPDTAVPVARADRVLATRKLLMRTVSRSSV
jgi:hypothetical protein